MAYIGSDKLASALTPTITLASLARSATAGRAGTALDFTDANGNIPKAIAVLFKSALANAGTIGDDKAIYLFAARTWDGTNYEVGKPAVSGGDAGFTFSNTPLGSGGAPSGFYLVGTLTFEAINTAMGDWFLMPGCKGLIPVVLPYTGTSTTLSSTSGDHVLSFVPIYDDVR